MNLSDEQQAVADQVETFLAAKRVDKPYFVFQGPAGTGKSTLMAHLARRHKRAKLCAFTGKAASVLSRKTGLEATTIHSAIYSFEGEDPYTKQLNFGAKIEDDDWIGHVAFIDESGTVTVQMARDLLATGCRVVACGDPGQLPPVNGEAFFTVPDAEIVEVHRQAWDSAIIRQAHQVKAGLRYEADGPDFQVTGWVPEDVVLGADMILCWRNVTRMQLNKLKRAYMGLDGKPLQAGEPVMCLRNDRRMGILNGAVYTLLEDHEIGSGRLCLTNERGHQVMVEEAWIEGMEGPRPDLGRENPSHPFAIGLCATVHKFQGSEADNVLLVDEYGTQDGWERWAYTGITRAAKKVIVKI